MQLNKVLKGLMLALPVMAVAACSSNKSNDNADQMINSGDSNGSMSAEEQARMMMQELQKNNIVYFGFDKYDIQPEFAQMLDAHAAFLRDNPSYKVVVEGHADERGTPEYNIALGERRANAVKMYLQGRGVNADQISIVSYGKEKPAVLGHTEDAYAKNRRAVLVY
ncbi:peptidoglycan-associated lipoprotein Pal [Plesiomonas shigelloides subsp. oncorhynchi]|uniref:Peptidoglycan-associated lipoprotein n=2 Tax=Plesiomonas shigelloides TaxID=703 RepID=R8AUX9_PLESH|nr:MULTISPECIES: peptidoglycan-associated lipoprotein Pal [Plesiomonas]AVQ86730.1 peptidoglycan-associated lipoprotein Pal [Plesiomonas shigelloides]EON90142.1 peptidoglycan-associated outer membrane lipoprotein [Plesiomonas shigelloides 302-73]KAB7659154.1 peptidoglycan-associated lipoprotein Pal [Plesiomonas shigelloides]KAB7665421.1 peptidoglycan-associated lipoprotein Pal [Plesiomonas shigelloides]KAB7668511.1 peptidoglycan-associated lipoprotein Pal [Plesiomonas shigelloides]